MRPARSFRARVVRSFQLIRWRSRAGSGRASPCEYRDVPSRSCARFAGFRLECIPSIKFQVTGFKFQVSPAEHETLNLKPETYCSAHDFAEDEQQDEDDKQS